MLKVGRAGFATHRIAAGGRRIVRVFVIRPVLVRQVCATILLSISVAACSGGGKNTCTKSQEYQASRQVDALEVPGDLDEPDRSGELVIPEVAAQSDQPPADQPCLERPPDYFDRKL